MNAPEDKKNFGHLDTDEEYVGEAHTKDDFDRMMLSGCVVFTLSSVAVLASVAIPILLQIPLQTNRQLASCVGLSVILALAVGGFSTWRTGISGLCGSFAGLIPAAVFVWLRIRGAVELPNIENMPPPEFSGSAAWAVPLGVLMPLGLVWYGIFCLHRRLERPTPGNP